ncbi:GGDEF domain-containing protein [Marinomonas colpomeniae]|uniref:GGDEF domain-containing protein n=1 Tax=Marinomonas colpomeniae TaxID=2774408 RepID=UPI0019D53922|nr:GGDEF domain-containing protein [Marinomonas colpomeniae]
MDTQRNLQLTDAKNTLHKWLSLFTGVIIVLFGMLNITVLQQLNIGLVELFFGLLNLYFFVMAVQDKNHKWHISIHLFSISITVLYTFYHADLRAGSIYWLLLAPAMFCLLAGARLGLIYTISLSFPIFIILFLKSDSDNNIPYRSLLNFTLAYYLTFLICYFYESQHMKNNISLHKMAFEDPLTKAKNRHALRLFFEEHNKKQEDSQYKEDNTQLLIVDIDHFKSVNDEFGHDVGDAVLVDMTALLKESTPNNHVYRIGGEEFLIILQDNTAVQAYDFAESIRKKVEDNEFHISPHNIQITVSIGVTNLEKNQNFREFLRNADKNLYSAKHLGRNLVHHDAFDNDKVTSNSPSSIQQIA